MRAAVGLRPVVGTTHAEFAEAESASVRAAVGLRPAVGTTHAERVTTEPAAGNPPPARL